MKLNIPDQNITLVCPNCENTFFSIDENNILMISGLNNPNAMHLDSQFNGKYIWTKEQFDIPCFKKYNGEIVLTNYGKK